jgi:uncharacterized protein YqcC (DUF446 family)
MNELQKKQSLNGLLIALCDALKKQGLWQTSLPPVTALQSTLPFAIDTLRFEQWLQFIFIEKLSNIKVLPSAILVTPMAQESFKSLMVDSSEIISILQKIDRLLA